MPNQTTKRPRVCKITIEKKKYFFSPIITHNVIYIFVFAKHSIAQLFSKNNDKKHLTENFFML